jgi:hypothetical protein
MQSDILKLKYEDVNLLMKIINCDFIQHERKDSMSMNNSVIKRLKTSK